MLGANRTPEAQLSRNCFSKSLRSTHTIDNFARLLAFLKGYFKSRELWSWTEAEQQNEKLMYLLPSDVEGFDDKWCTALNQLAKRCQLNNRHGHECRKIAVVHEIRLVFYSTCRVFNQRYEDNETNFMYQSTCVSIAIHSCVHLRSSSSNRKIHSKARTQTYKELLDTWSILLWFSFFFEVCTCYTPELQLAGVLTCSWWKRTEKHSLPAEQQCRPAGETCSSGKEQSSWTLLRCKTCVPHGWTLRRVEKLLQNEKDFPPLPADRATPPSSRTQRTKNRSWSVLGHTRNEHHVSAMGN